MTSTLGLLRCRAQPFAEGSSSDRSLRLGPQQHVIRVGIGMRPNDLVGSATEYLGPRRESMAVELGCGDSKISKGWPGGWIRSIVTVERGLHQDGLESASEGIGGQCGRGLRDV